LGSRIKKCSKRLLLRRTVNVETMRGKIN
jgi:hypothetical protein